jgi:hypothetical protein
MSPSAPTTEIGRPSLGYTLPGWDGFAVAVDEREYAPDLIWPQSIETYRRMETDAQIAGLLLGTMLPIRRFRWFIDPDGASDQVTEHIARDFNLPIKGEDAPPPVPRSERNRFSHDRHLAHALRALPLGHYPFEQVGVIGTDERFHLTKLAPRPPYTIANGGSIELDKNGGLAGIKQGIGLSAKLIPVNRLVYYCWDQEGADWFGRSMIRPCFRHWARKDRLLRVDAMKHERNSMGVPWFETGPELSQPQVDALAATAQRMRSGDQAGGAGPGKLQIKGVDGALPDIIESIRYDDQQMTMATLMLFVDLGRNSETGSRSLGSEFIDWYGYAQESIADWYAGVTTEHAIWDIVDWSYGEDENAPKLGYDRSAEEDLPVSDLSLLIDKGVIEVDDPIKDAIREKYSLPERDLETEPPVEIATEPVAARKRKPVKAAAVGHREPTEIEVKAATDFDQMQADYVSERDQLVADVQSTQGEQIDEITGQVTDADGDLEQLAAITVTPLAAAAIVAVAKRVARNGVAQVTAEAKAQGVTAAAPDLDEIDESLSARAAALDKNLADTLGQAASKKALSLSGAALAPADVATAVRGHLEGLSTAYLDEQLGGLVQQSQNTGRRETMRANPPSKVYGSALLDTNTCGPCEDHDGEEYPSIEDAEQDYPVGGLGDCEGGLRCRCTVIAEWT